MITSVTVLYTFLVFHAVPFIRFTQQEYTQNENSSPLSVRLVLDPFGGGGSGQSSISQAIVCQIVASVQPGDTATGK